MTAGYVVPFAVYVVALELGRLLPLDYPTEYGIRIGLTVAALALYARRAIPIGPVWNRLAGIIGVLTFTVWISPELIFGNYRSSWSSLSFFGDTINSSLDLSRASLGFLAFRTFGASVVVPIVEELFWRGWLMRWLIAKDFQSLPFGTYSRFSFWATALLFSLEHGSYWDVGLLAGIAYNYVAIRTRSLGACIFSHGLTNLLLSVYVIATCKWHYWV